VIVGEHGEAQQRRADQLRAQIEELCTQDPSGPRSRRECTDDAAAEDRGNRDGEAPAEGPDT
jgi:hypothetical protein